MKKLKSLLFLVVLFIQLFAQDQKQIAITLDDLPTLSHGLISQAEQTVYFNRILKILEKYKIKSTGFVVGQSVSDKNKSLIKSFIKQGHSIGNHTFSHPDLNKTSCRYYINNIKKNQNLISNFNIKHKYFRYPMLHRGDSKEKRDSIYHYLQNEKYTIAPVTIDNDETTFNIKFVRAYFSGNNAKADSLGKAYVNHMIEKSLYYDQLGYKLTGRSVKHILLLHMNFINSFYLDHLLKWYKNNNWIFISLADALSDPLYIFEDMYIGKKGISWLERIHSSMK